MKKKRRELKFHGGGLGGLKKLSPFLQRVKDFLDALPVDEVYSSEGLSDELKISRNHLQTNLKRLGDKYRYIEGAAIGYGNPETVKLKKEGFYDKEESED